MVNGALDLGQVPHDHDREHVHRDVELIAPRVVRRPEARPYHSGVAHRAAAPAAGQLRMRVVRTGIVVLFVAHDFEHARVRAIDGPREDRPVTRDAPILVCERDRIEQRIDFEFSLDDFVVDGKRVSVRID